MAKFDALKWVRSAASTEKSRPEICALHVVKNPEPGTDFELAEATDGFRVHRVLSSIGLAPGTWFDGENLEASGRRYPNISHLYESFAHREWIEVPDSKLFVAVVTGAAATMKAMGHKVGDRQIVCSLTDERCNVHYYNPELLLNAVKPFADVRIDYRFAENGAVEFRLIGAAPFECSAIVMCLRMADGHGAVVTNLSQI